MSCTNQSGGIQNGGSNKKKQRGGDGAHGRTVFDSVYYGRPEYGFYNDAEMAKMGAMVGGCDDMKKHQKQQKQHKGGDGAHGRTVFDSVYYGRPEYGFYNDAEMAAMGAKVGGCGGTVYTVEGTTMNKQRGGGSERQNSQHKMRIRGIITNMIDVSNSKDKDIVEVLQHELKEDNKTRYTKKEATQILKEYYVFNQEKTKKSMNGDRTYPSNLLEKFIGEYEQKGGNRVTLPLSFFTGEIPDKIVVPPHVDNYCAF